MYFYFNIRIYWYFAIRAVVGWNFDSQEQQLKLRKTQPVTNTSLEGLSGFTSMAFLQTYGELYYTYSAAWGKDIPVNDCANDSVYISIPVPHR